MPRHPSASRTCDGLSSSIYEVVRQRARSVPPLVHALHVGDSWREPPAAARCETVDTASHPLVHAYPPVHGDPRLLDLLEQSLSARAGRDIPRANIQVVAGATGGLSVACQALIDPGDEVIIPTPCWPLIPGIVSSRGGVAVQAPVMTRMGEPGFDLAAALERLVTPRTVALYINSPHNPTGACLSSADAAAIAALAARHDLWVFADDVYEHLVHDGTAPEALWAREDLAGRTIGVHSASKSYAMAGCRVGWLHGPAEPMAAIRAVFAHQAYAVAHPMQRLAARALVSGGPWLAETRALYANAASRAAALLRVATPASGTFIFADAAPFVRDGESVIDLLGRCLEAGVLLCPGAACGGDFDGWFRLCFTAVDPGSLDDAIERLAPVLAR